MIQVHTRLFFLVYQKLEMGTALGLALKGVGMRWIKKVQVVEVYTDHLELHTAHWQHEKRL